MTSMDVAGGILADTDREGEEQAADLPMAGFDKGLSALRLLTEPRATEPPRPVRPQEPLVHPAEPPPAPPSDASGPDRDHLSGLGTRRDYTRNIAQILDGRRKAGQAVGIALINLHNMKSINDRFGYRAGDYCIREISRRLQVLAGQPDWIYRLGGDEFILAFAREPAAIGGDGLFPAIAEAVAVPLAWRGHEFSVACCIGVTYGEVRSGLSPLRLLERAGIALTTARRAGAGNIAYYSKDLRRAARREFDVVQKTAVAIGEGRAAVFLQPKVQLSDRSVRGYEALIRLKQRDGTYLSPYAFSEALEDPVTSRKIGQFVLREVSALVEALAAIGHAAPNVAINLSSADFHGESAVDEIVRLVSSGRLSPERLQVEVTERTLIDARDADVRSALQTLSDIGVRISLDDFGTGYASLIHLRDLVFHKIKIDRSFIQNICSSPADLAIVKATISLAKDLGKLVIAEGIETEEQEAVLLGLGCDMGQGYLYGRPQPWMEVLQQETSRRFGSF